MSTRKKNSNFRIYIIVLLLLLSVGCIYNNNPTAIDNVLIVTGRQTEPTATVTAIATSTPSSIIPAPTDNNGTIKVGAFNIQVFGISKASKPEVLGVLSKIIRNYDVITVQEIRDSSQTALPALRDAVDAIGTPQYDYIVSERLGRTTSKEQYAYLYNTQTIQQIGSPYSYPDTNDLFHREPFVAEFKTINGNFDFVLITIHTDPDTAAQEINDLPKVVEAAKSKYQGEGDYIVMDDLNADCSHFNEKGQSPTTKSTDCTYDWIIITSPAKMDYTGFRVFRFDTAYNLNYDSTIAVSDHYPVFASFWSNRDTDWTWITTIKPFSFSALYFLYRRLGDKFYRLE